MKKNWNNTQNRQAIIGILVCSAFLIGFYAYTGKNREYNVIANQFDISMDGTFPKRNKLPAGNTNTKITFKRGKVWFYDNSRSNLLWSFTIGAGQTIKKRDTLVTYLTGQLKDIKRNESDDEVIKISTSSDKSSVVCVCDYDSTCFRYFIPAKDDTPVPYYQMLFPATVNHKYVDSIFDMNQSVNYTKTFKRVSYKFHKNYQP